MPTYSLTLRSSLNRRLSITELDDNFRYVEQLAISGTSGGGTGSVGPQGPQGATGSDGATGPAGPSGGGTASSVTMSAHVSLTSFDVGKFVVSYTDHAGLIDHVTNLFPVNTFTGSVNEARVAFYAGGGASQDGIYTLDFAATYSTGYTDVLVDELDASDQVFYNNVDTGSIDSFYILYKNLGFQTSDTYFSSLLTEPGFTYSTASVSYPSNYDSYAMMFKYYADNGFPQYDYDPSKGHTVSTTIVASFSVTVSGAEATITYPVATVQEIVDIQYYGSVLGGYKPTADQELEEGIPEYLTHAVVGRLSNLSGSVATIDSYPDLVTLTTTYSNYGTYAVIPTGDITYDTYFVSNGGSLRPFYGWLNGTSLDNDDIVAEVNFNTLFYRPLSAGSTLTDVNFAKVEVNQ
jgi:hypothetical protein